MFGLTIIIFFFPENLLIGPHHTDKNSMYKELGVSKRHDDAMRHFDQIPPQI